MKRTNKIRSLSTLLVVMLALIIGTLFAVPALASDEYIPEDTAVRIEMTPIKYEFDDNSGYKFNFNDVVTGYCNGINQMGTLEVEGSGIVKTSYNGVDAIAIKGGSTPVIKYTQNVSSTNYDGHEWTLSNDTFTSVEGVGTHTVGNGAIVIFKSSDNINYEYVTNMVNINGQEITYQISANDLANGCYFKILTVAEVYYSYISGYHTAYPNGWKKFWGYGGYSVADYSNYYRNIGSAYTFFVGDDSCTVAYNSSSSDAINFNENEALSEAEVEYLRSATSLTDGAVSFSDIKVDFCGISSNKVTLSYNGEEEIPVKDGDVYSESGAYKFKVESIFGTVSERTIYIMDMGYDLGFSKFFNSGLCDESVRMFDDRFAVPCYMTGMCINISDASFTPGIYGTIIHTKDGKTTNTVDTLNGVSEGYSKVLTDEGLYVAEFYSSDPAVKNGDIALYRFAFAISENRDYAPTANYNLITSTSRNILFGTKMLAVALKTAGGGSYLYCFPSTEEYQSQAHEFAEKIEMLSVESYVDDDGSEYWFYKSKNNPNVKVRYEGNAGKRVMFEVIAANANENVNVIYVDPDSSYAITPASDIEALKRLTESSITNDVKVVIDENVRYAMLAEEIYLNGFTFQQIASYESAAVVAVDLETGEPYYIGYGVDLAEIFIKTTKVRIKENNWNGSKTYDTVWYAPGDNQGTMTLTVDGESCLVTKVNEDHTYTGNKISLDYAIDNYDSNAIVSIKNPKTGETRIILAAEVENITIPDGYWEISIINRFAVGYSIFVTVKEEITDDESKSFNNLEFGDGKKFSSVSEEKPISTDNNTPAKSPSVYPTSDKSTPKVSDEDSSIYIGIIIASIAVLLSCAGTVAFLLKKKRHR